MNSNEAPRPDVLPAYGRLAEMARTLGYDDPDGLGDEPAPEITAGAPSSGTDT